MMVQHPPHTFRPGHAPSPISLILWMSTFGWLFCCPAKRLPPKAKTPSLYFFLMGCILAHQTKDRRVARAHLRHHTIDGPIWSSSAKIWVHGGCCYGKRGQKPLKGWVAAAHVGCCVLWLCFVLCLAVEHCISSILYSRAPHPCWYFPPVLMQDSIH